MRKIRVANDVQICCVKNFNPKGKFIDYFIDVPGEEKIYVFSKRYSESTYNLCKSGMRLNRLMCTKTRNQPVMQLVKYTRFLLPYLIEEYLIPVAV